VGEDLTKVTSRGRTAQDENKQCTREKKFVVGSEKRDGKTSLRGSYAKRRTRQVKKKNNQGTAEPVRFIRERWGHSWQKISNHFTQRAGTH